jgi:hypothetical protein
MLPRIAASMVFFGTTNIPRLERLLVEQICQAGAVHASTAAAA